MSAGPWPVAVWAPNAERVDVETGGELIGMHPGARPGWWQAELPTGPGTDYAFRLDGSEPMPDPRSAWQPQGVHGPSRLVDHAAFEWTDGAWPGRGLPGNLVYELHIGTFTPGGTFDAAIERLDHLVDLGVDLVEVMPVAAFPGEHGWGYDGVALWAVHEPYGGPDGFKRFVDACHGRGLGVVLDVVYNHLGPSGNYLGRFGPYFTEVHQTPWGAAVNLDAPGSDEVRRYIVENALTWLRDYHIDGLRLDAVHALVDSRAIHVLEELAIAVDGLAATSGRPLFLIAESDLNDPRVITAREAGGHGMHGQWNDDFHHALHSTLTGERQGYYADFASPAALAKTLTGAYFHDGGWSSFRERSHGRRVDVLRIPGTRFVGYLQNHDQIGNRAVGDRISATLSPGLLRVGAALLLTSPFTPMLFMGEEWGASTPWQFFTDHPEPALAESVRKGRRREFADHGWSEDQVPDPQDPATFARSRLDWSEPGREPHRDVLDWYRDLVALRRAWPELADSRLDRVRVDLDEATRWLVVHRGSLRVVANLDAAGCRIPVPGAGEVLLASTGQVRRDGDDMLWLPGESVAVVRTGEPAYAAPGGAWGGGQV
jgi:maltooligosyltrehalose trehalohydrolase